MTKPKRDALHSPNRCKVCVEPLELDTAARPTDANGAALRRDDAMRFARQHSEACRVAFGGVYE